MGLDMYLTGSVFIWSSQTIKSLEPLRKELGLNKKHEINRVEFELIYWRKANMIHKWFVENIQDGKDDCGKYAVTIDELKALHSIVVLVLDNNNSAEELLPNQEGFFFGGVEYDEYYFDDLRDTKKQLEDLFKEKTDNMDITYRSSW